MPELQEQLYQRVFNKDKANKLLQTLMNAERISSVRRFSKSDWLYCLYAIEFQFDKGIERDLYIETRALSNLLSILENLYALQKGAKGIFNVKRNVSGLELISFLFTIKEFKKGTRLPDAIDQLKSDLRKQRFVRISGYYPIIEAIIYLVMMSKSIDPGMLFKSLGSQKVAFGRIISMNAFVRSDEVEHGFAAA